MNKDEEYECFKSLCRRDKVKINEPNSLIVKSLNEKGLDVTLDNDLFLLNESIVPLSEVEIRAGLSHEINLLISELDIIYSTTSTNQKISQKYSDELFSVLASEYQSDGQGRRERKWVSPLGCNIYLSIQFQLKTNNAHFIPLLTGLSICRALESYGIVGCMIKWPNDIYFNGKKLGGILVESRYSATNEPVFVVGIGLNVNMQHASMIDQPWTSLQYIQKDMVNRNNLLSMLLNECLNTYMQLPYFDKTKFLRDWSALDWIFGKDIIVTEEGSSYPAIARGIADDGALLIDYDVNNTKLHKQVYSADVSIKSQSSF